MKKDFPLKGSQQKCTGHGGGWAIVPYIIERSEITRSTTEPLQMPNSIATFHSPNKYFKMIDLDIIRINIWPHIISLG